MGVWVAVLVWLVAVLAEGVRCVVLYLSMVYQVAAGAIPPASPTSLKLAAVRLWVIFTVVASALLFLGIKVGGWLLVAVTVALAFWIVVAISGARQGWRQGNAIIAQHPEIFRSERGGTAE